MQCLKKELELKNNIFSLSEEELQISSERYNDIVISLDAKACNINDTDDLTMGYSFNEMLIEFSLHSCVTAHIYNDITLFLSDSLIDLSSKGI